MAQVKILLENNEDLDQVKETLAKAWTAIEEDFSEGRDFTDPVLQQISDKLDSEFKEYYNKIFNEIMTIVHNPSLYR